MTIKNQNMALVVLLGDVYHKTKKLLVDGNYMMKCLDTFRVYYLRLCDDYSWTSATTKPHHDTLARSAN
jgi:hypothetical protein